MPIDNDKNSITHQNGITTISTATISKTTTKTKFEQSQFGSELSLYDENDHDYYPDDDLISLENLYNEKAIDVPEDFEREAYAKLHKSINNNITASSSISNKSPFRRFIKTPIRQLSPTLKDFLQVSFFLVFIFRYIRKCLQSQIPNSQ